MVDRIDAFSDDYAFLSNFWPAEVQLDGITYPTVEHGFQAAKTDNPVKRERIRHTPSPAKAKVYSHDRIPRPPGWNARRVQIMRELLHQKFKPGSPLAIYLVQTHPATLIGGNTWHDTFWGVCTCQRHGDGTNQLGQLLMEIRVELLDTPEHRRQLDGRNPGGQTR